MFQPLFGLLVQLQEPDVYGFVTALCRTAPTVPQQNGDQCNSVPVEILDWAVGSSNTLVYRLLGGYLDGVKAASRTTIV